MARIITLIIILPIFILISHLKECNAEQKDELEYAFHFPKSVIVGLPFTACLTITESYLPATLSVGFQELNSTKSSYNITKGYSCFLVNVPVLSQWQRFTTIFIEIDSNIRNVVVLNQQYIGLNFNHNETFIETDRAFYKMGEVVKIRMLTLGHNLKPPKDFEIPLVEIFSPSKTKIAVWKNIKAELGLTQLEFQLASETEIGEWQIVTTYISHTFRVEKYVLPRYKVNIIAPDNLYFKNEIVKISVCAKYSYGKSVQGKALLHATTTLYRYRWYDDNSSKNVSKLEKLNNGCAEFTFMKEELQWDSVPDVTLSASVTEDDTDQVEFNSKKLTTVHSPFSLNLIKHYYKPGLPFFGKIKLENINVPIENEILQICCVAGKYFDRICSNITVDADNIADFTLPPFKKEADSMEINAKPIRYPNVILYQSISSWLSTSDNFLQIQKINPSEIPNCGSFLSFNIMYTSKDLNREDEITFYYIVLSRGDILEMSQVIDTPKKNHLRLEDYSTLVGTTEHLSFENSVDMFNLSIKLTTEMYSDTKLVVYYVFGKEVIADELDITIKKCYRKIKASWSVNSLYPGEMSTLNIKTFKNSLCAITSVDKASRFMSEVKPINIDSIISKYDNSFYSHGDNSLNCIIPNTTIETSTVAADTSILRAQPLLQGPPGPHPPPGMPVQGMVPLPGIPPASGLQPGAMLHIPSGIYEPPVPSQPGPISPEIHAPRIAVLSRAPTMPEMGYPAPPYGTRYIPGHASGIYQQEYVENWVSPSGFDTYDLLKDTNLGVMSNLQLLSKTCKKERQYLQSRQYAYPMGYGSAPTMAFGAPGISPMASQYIPASPRSGLFEIDKGSLEERGSSIRSFFPETWLWELLPISESTIVRIERKLPDSITNWETSVLCVSEENGVRISNIIEINAFKPFFIDVIVPYSMKRSTEILHLPVKIFNYLNNTLEVRIGLIETEGIVLEDGEKSNNQILIIEGQESQTHYFRIKATKLGRLNLTVEAFPKSIGGDTTTLNRDTVQKDILVEPEGYRSELVKSTLLCANDSKSIDNIQWNLVLPENIVPDTASGKIIINSDILGPMFQNLENILVVPTGCGEQTMATLTPNLYVLKYLEANKALTEDIKERILKNLKLGYQRILTYVHYDGSFSAFGGSDHQGSMFLTAFVVRTLSQMKNYIAIDDNVIRKAVEWMAYNQHENGCFNPMLHVFHDMGMASESGQTTALTAYVLISALETNLNMDKDKIYKARVCLLRNDNHNKYTTAITSYAFSLMNATFRTNLLLKELMDTSNRENNLLWWSEGESSHSTNIEMSSYVVMTLLQQNITEHAGTAGSIVRWLQTKMSPRGGFFSTVDTVVGLDAISRFATLINDREPNLAVQIDTNGNKKEISVLKRDQTQTNEHLFSDFPTTVNVKVIGDGCVSVQGAVSYYLQETITSDLFKLNVNTTLLDKKNQHSSIELKSCISYTGSGQSNMAILEVTMPSGYIPEQTSLYSSLSNGAKKFEQIKNQVVFYFVQLTKKEVCVPLTITQELLIENVTNATITLYDYYKPEISISKSFNIN